MNIPSEFDAIRPWEPEELTAAYDRLTSDRQFMSVVEQVYPDVPVDMLKKKLYACKTNLDFQKSFCYPFVKSLEEKATKGMEFDSSAIDNTRNYTFISNHRDIVTDSAFLDYLLLVNGFSQTCEIAIGDNLLKFPWIKDLVRINKSFIVERGLPMRQMLASSKRLSEYIHYSVETKKQNIWIAQREGRAKDSDDRTQEGIMKMMTMGGGGSVVDRLKSLHIVPLAISYEYDPCDFLKAKEMQQKRDVDGWKKGPDDDVISMKTGIMGFKGHVHYHAAPCLDEWLGTLDAAMPRKEVLETVARHIDHEIHSNYMIYPNNWIALDELDGKNAGSAHYTAGDKQKFDAYISAQLARINLAGKDEAFLRERMLTMYANPLKNYLIAKGK